MSLTIYNIISWIDKCIKSMEKDLLEPRQNKKNYVLGLDRDLNPGPLTI